MTFASEGTGQNINIAYQPGGFNGTTVFAGIYNWTPSTTTVGGKQVANPWPLDYPFSSFCIDLKQVFYANTTYQFTVTPVAYAPVDTTGAAYSNGDPTSDNPNAMGTLAAADLGRLWATDEGKWTGTTTQQNEAAAAFQVAVWAVVYDQSILCAAQNVSGLTKTEFLSGFSVADSSIDGISLPFYLTSGTDSTVIADANNDLWDALFSSKSTNMLAALTSPTFQDQLVIMPVPSSFSAGMLLLGCLVCARRRIFVSLEQ